MRNNKTGPILFFPAHVVSKLLTLLLLALKSKEGTFLKITIRRLKPKKDFKFKIFPIHSNLST